MNTDKRPSEERLKEIFTSATGNEPLFLAFSEVLRQHEEENKITAIMPNLTAEDRAFNCGRCAAIVDVLFSISNYDVKNLLTKSESDTTSDS